MMLLIIDNYDSFVFNIGRYFAELGATTRIVRNDAMTIGAIGALVESGELDGVILSPGPRAPEHAGVSLEVVRRLSGRTPILGICLGHQCIGAAFGAHVTRAVEPLHGRGTDIGHNGLGIFAGLPNPLAVGRYHSLVVVSTPASAPHLRVDARSPCGEIMALSHLTHPTYGVQFHPESVLTTHGHHLLANFIDLAASWRRR